MNIDFELYRLFYTVAKCKNFTIAASELCISQPAISKSIKNLEDQLGGQLFVRTKRGVTLTQEGRELYNYISVAIENITNGENRFSQLINSEIGVIKIGISVTLTKNFLIPFLKKFHQSYPKIEIQIITNKTSELINKLKNGLIDMVILNINKYDYGKEIEIIKIKEINDCFIVNEDYLELTKRNMSINELNNYPLILQAKGSNTRDFIDNYAKSNNITFKPNMEPASSSLVIEFAKIGFGIGHATKQNIENELSNHVLYELNIKEKIPSRYIGIAYSKVNLLSFSAKKLIDIILQNDDNK